MRVLVTNDDGIDSAGLHALAGAARDCGHDVVVAAPNREYSGASAAVTGVEQHGRILYEPRALPGLDGVPAFSVAASPAFVVIVALHGAFGPAPDVVLSGVNLGANAGRAVTHSGTVGAALTGALDGRRAAAFSIGMMMERPANLRFDVAARVARDLMPTVCGLPPGVVLNVNIPNLPYDQLGGVRRGPLASFGAVQFVIAERDHGYVRVSLADSETELEEGTDEYLLAKGFVVVTPLRPVAEATDVELAIAD